MADWTDLDVNNLLPGEPWTSAKALATYENPIAAAEGAEGAPRVQGIALGNVFTGEVVNKTDYITDLGRVAELLLLGRWVPASSGSSLFVAQFSTDGGATITGGNQTLISLPGPDEYTLPAHLNLVTGTFKTGNTTASVTVPSGVNAVRISSTAGTANVILMPLIIAGRA